MSQVEVPEGWKLHVLEDIVKEEKNSIKRGPWGSTIKKDFFVSQGYKVYQQYNVIYNDFDYGNYYLDYKKYNELKEFEVRPGDFLISCSGTIGKVSIVPEGTRRGIMNQALLKISIDENKINSRYFLYMLKSNLIQNQILTKGSAMKNVVAVKELKKIKFYMPTNTKTQEKIVQKLGNILEQLEGKKRIILQLIEKNSEHLKFLNNNLLLDFIEKTIPLHKLPSGWKLESLSEVCMVERGKFGHRPRNDPEYFGGRYPFIQTGDIANSNGRIITYKQTLNEKGLKVSRMFPKGTVVITIAANIGDTAILDFDSCFPDSIIGIIPKKGKAIPEYIEYVLRLYQFDLEKNASKGAQKNINYGFLKPLMMPIPPVLDIQCNLVKKIKDAELKINQLKNEVKSIIDKNQKIKKYLDNLDSTVLDSAFNGKLVH